ncbi:unnamed protein product [Caenorhabditis bovis]|uniref:Uncharacterized protein n=1 Tax=Caenorhabditis bovis TaxID=2654633 RepID=A0A8S1EHZ5_9PELO|nr:unnamed protein product [Caenorhabditis bovis]
MFGVKEIIFIIGIAVVAVSASKRNAQCDYVCQGKMTIECCECIGCHQGMRFGKRANMVSPPEEVEDARAVEEMARFEKLIGAMENEIAARSQRMRLQYEKQAI